MNIIRNQINNFNIIFSAVVSIQPPRTDFTAAAAQAATGAPLLAHTPFSTVQYQSFMMPQPASYQVGQVDNLILIDRLTID